MGCGLFRLRSLGLGKISPHHWGGAFLRLEFVILEGRVKFCKPSNRTGTRDEQTTVSLGCNLDPNKSEQVIRFGLVSAAHSRGTTTMGFEVHVPRPKVQRKKKKEGMKTEKGGQTGEAAQVL